jgi:hypothetical protein
MPPVASNERAEASRHLKRLVSSRVQRYGERRLAGMGMARLRATHAPVMLL